jgi:dihydropteroate synthase
VGVDPAGWYLRPVGRLTGAAARLALAAGQAIPTGRAGEAVPFLEILVRQPPDLHLLNVPDFRRWLDRIGQTPVGLRLAALIERLSRPRAPWAGFTLDRPLVMGILNITPDSFSDGGRHLDPSRAIETGRAMLAAGADIIDIGGESTRPGAEPVPPETEIARVMPVVTALAEAGAVVSIDTRHAPVMAAALGGGARIVNDVNALQAPDAVRIVARTNTATILMHMQGDPQRMQDAPAYEHAPLDVLDFLETRIAACEAAGIERQRILVDPGIGFGKTLAHNLAILRGLGLYRTTGCGVLLGVSRKRFIATLSAGEAADHRLPGSLAAALAGLAAGADVIRVHDVPETMQALRIAAALESDDESA